MLRIFYNSILKAAIVCILLTSSTSALPASPAETRYKSSLRLLGTSLADQHAENIVNSQPFANDFAKGLAGEGLFGGKGFSEGSKFRDGVKQLSKEDMNILLDSFHKRAGDFKSQHIDDFREFTLPHVKYQREESPRRPALEQQFENIRERPTFSKETRRVRFAEPEAAAPREEFSTGRPSFSFGSIGKFGSSIHSAIKTGWNNFKESFRPSEQRAMI